MIDRPASLKGVVRFVLESRRPLDAKGGTRCDPAQLRPTVAASLEGACDGFAETAQTTAYGRQCEFSLAAENCPSPARPSSRTTASRRGCELTLPAKSRP